MAPGLEAVDVETFACPGEWCGPCDARTCTCPPCACSTCRGRGDRALEARDELRAAIGPPKPKSAVMGPLDEDFEETTTAGQPARGGT